MNLTGFGSVKPTFCPFCGCAQDPERSQAGPVPAGRRQGRDDPAPVGGVPQADPAGGLAARGEITPWPKSTAWADPERGRGEDRRVSWGKLDIKLKSADQVDKMQASAEILASVFLEIRELVATRGDHRGTRRGHRDHDPGSRLCPFFQGISRVPGVRLHFGERGSRPRDPLPAAPGRGRHRRHRHRADQGRLARRQRRDHARGANRRGGRPAARGDQGMPGAGIAAIAPGRRISVIGAASRPTPGPTASRWSNRWSDTESGATCTRIRRCRTSGASRCRIR